MAKYIELMGPPGVGKTTTFLKLYTKQKDEDNFILYKSKKASRIERMVNRIGNFIFPKPVKHKDDHLIRFNKNNQELINLFWNHIHSNKNSDGEYLRYYTVLYMFRIFEKVQKIKDHDSEKYIVLDEGITHSLGKFIDLQSEGTYEQQLDQILNIMDLPQAIIFLGGEVDVIVQRTIDRGSRRLKDKDLSKEMLLAARTKSILEREKWLHALKKKKIPLLYLDAEESVDNKVDKIISFINQLP